MPEVLTRVDEGERHADLCGYVVEAAIRLRKAKLAIRGFWASHDERAPYADMRIYELAAEEVCATGAFDKAVDALTTFESQHSITK